MKKKTFIAILCLILVFSLGACSSPKGGDISANKNDEEKPIDKQEEIQDQEDDYMLDGDDVLVFNDKELERLIRDVLEIETDDILVEYLEDLEVLEFNGDDYDVKDLDGLQYAENLRAIRMKNLDIKSLKPIAKLQKLDDIMFWDGTIGELPEKFNNPSISSVEISNTNISDFSSLEGSPLRYLTLRDNGIKSIDFVRSMQNLEAIDMQNNLVSDLSPLEDKEDIDYINFENNQLSDIDVLITLTGLEAANLSDNPDIIDIDALVDHPNLQVLTFYSFSGDRTILEDLENSGLRVSY